MEDMKTNLYAVLLLLAMIELCGGQDLTSTVPPHLYPVGPGVGDNTAPVNDDGSTGELFISVPFPYFDQLHSSLFVNTNGAISFLREVRQFTPDPLPLSGSRRIITAFWGDVDTRNNNGRVYWRETTDIVILSRATSDVRNAFVDQDHFQAAWVFVTTWYNVTYYGGSTTTSRNTLQAVLVTNGRHSFVLFNYGDINWTTGGASGGEGGLGGTPAQAGFNAGDGVRYFSIPGSRTADIVDVETTSNVGLPGRWVFRVDEADVLAGGCNTAGSLAVGPRFASALGGKRVTVAGPCFNVAIDDVVCRFDDVTVSGEVIDEIHASCVVPATFTLGRRSFELSVDGGNNYNYQGIFWFVGEDDSDHTVHRINPAAWHIIDLDQTLVIQWHHEILKTDTVDIEFVIFRKQLDGDVIMEAVTLSSDAENTGEFELSDRLENAQTLISAKYGAIRVSERYPIETGKEKQSIWSTIDQSIWYDVRYYYEVALRMSTANTTLNNGRRKRDVFHMVDGFTDDLWDSFVSVIDGVGDVIEDIKSAVSNNINEWRNEFNENRCHEWYTDEQDHPPDLTDLTASPCTLDQAINDPAFIADTACNMGEGCTFHTGAFHCVRSAEPSSIDGSGQQACYDREGRILPFASGGGTYDRSHVDGHFASFKVIYISHFFDDVLPYMYCCDWTDNCAKYSEFRPTHDCSGYTDPGVAATSGDPHVTTLNGISYTFNGIGEFVFLAVDDGSLLIQARAERYVHPTAGAVDASVWSAIALQAAGSDTVQVSTSERLGIEVRVNGATLTFDDLPSQHYTGVAVEHISHSIIYVRFDGGSGVKVTETMRTLSFLPILSSSLKGQTSGLLGLWNNNTDDDFLTPDGATIPTSASAQEIYHQFGSRWRTTENDSLFTYPMGKSHADYQDPSFIPMFEVSPTHPNYQHAVDICGDNVQCQYDYIATGEENIARATLQSSQEYLTILEDIQPVITCGFPEIPVHGSGNTTNGPVGVVVMFWCNEGYDLQGSYDRECMEDGRWSGEQPQCIATRGSSGYDCNTNNPCSPSVIVAGQYFYQHVNPNNYVQCDTQGRCYEKLCTAGLVWDPVINACSRPATTSTATTTTTTTSPTPGGSGYDCGSNNPCSPTVIIAGQYIYQHVSPSQYIQCGAWGQCYEMSCAPGLVWNPSANACDYAP